MGTETLSTSISTGITLSTAGPDLSPFTITPTGEISAGSGSTAVFSSLASPLLLNTGVISAGLDGVLFTHGGAVRNFGDHAEISGTYGIVAIGALAIVENFGTIRNGVSLLAGGDLSNSGLISAPDNLGVKLDGGGGIVNFGTIFGYGAAGSYATKLSGPTYVVEAAVFAGSSGSVNITNPGLIETEGTFPTGGTLWAGIVLAATGSVVNSGTIMSGYDVIDVFSSTASYVENNGLLLESASGTFAAGHGPGVGVLFRNAAGTAVNSGTIMASYGLVLDQGGIAENTRSGVIDASQAGISDLASGVTVLNNGVIESSGLGIYLLGSGTIMNTGIVSGGSYGAIILAASAMVMNTGTVIGTHGNYGIVTSGGGATINNSGLIQSTGTGGSGNYLGIWFTTGTNNTAINSGIIDATRTGILAGAEAYIDNLAGGTIIGGVRSGVGATVVNSGTINGQGFRAVLFTSGYDNRLIVNPGAVFIDPVDGGDAVGATGSSELDLGAGQGSLGGLGSLFVDFQTIAFEAGAAWTLSGDADGLAAGQVIDGVGLDDTLVLTGFAFTSASLVTGAGIELGNGAQVETLALQGSLALNDFLITTDGANTTLVETIVSQPVAVSGAAPTVGAGVTVQNPTLAGGSLILASGASIIGNISITGTGSTLVIEPDSQGDTTVPGNEITGFTAGDTIELAGVSFTSSGGAFGTPGEDTYTVATAGTLSIDADGTDYKLLIAGAIVGQNNFVLRGDLEITEIGTSTVFITTATPYTLVPGSEISISSATPNNDNEAGEAIFTSFSSGSAGPTIIIDGTVIDNAESFSPDQYAIQSRATADATLTNDGTITAANIFAGGFNNGTITNQAGATVSGTGGIEIGTGSLPSTIINEGTILGSSQQGVRFLNQSAQGVITNASGGLIRGGASGGSISESGIYISSGTVSNAGIIEQGASAGFSVDFFGTTGGNELILDPGQVLKGVATASGSGNFILLGGTGAGTLANPSNYHGFTLVSVATGADWQIGTSSSAVSIAGVSTIDVNSTLNVVGSLTGTTIDMEGDGAGSALVLNGTSSGLHFYNEVTDFGATDSIVITNFDLPAGQDIVYDYANGTLSVTPEGVGLTDQFALSGPNGNLNNSDGVVASGQPSGQFKFTTLSNGDLVISDLPCFAAGTRILTPNGEVAVEDLEAGDAVLTAREGFETIATIIWTGQRTIDLARHAMPEKARPVRILAGAFAPGLPERDLLLSPDHALFIDGHLIEAKTLVNGVTVIADNTIRHVTYHHIELARHDVVLAEGLPAETYLASGNRQNFESDAAPVVLHPDFAAASRKNACAPLLTNGRIVTAARQRLLDRALALGFAVTGDVDLVVRSGLERIWPSESDDGELLFVLPAKARQVQLLSGTGVPAEISADPDDRRLLGVAVTGLALIAGGVRHRIPLDDAAHEGFHEYEAGHRWTKGAARISLPPYSGRAVLEVAIHGQAARWSSAASRQLSG